MQPLESPSRQLSCERRILGLTEVFRKDLFNKEILIMHLPRTAVWLLKEGEWREAGVKTTEFWVSKWGGVLTFISCRENQERCSNNSANNSPSTKWCANTLHATTSHANVPESYAPTSYVSLSPLHPWCRWRSHNRCGRWNGGGTWCGGPDDSSQIQICCELVVRLRWAGKEGAAILRVFVSMREGCFFFSLNSSLFCLLLFVPAASVQCLHNNRLHGLLLCAWRSAELDRSVNELFTFAS